MRMPALRLPAWRPSFDWFDGVNRRAVLLYGLYTGILFFIFLLGNLPAKVLVQQVMHSAALPGMRFDFDDARFAWLRGIELQRPRLVSDDPGRPPFLEATSLFVRPGLSGLLRGEVRSLQVGGQLYGGTLDGSFASGDLQRGTITLDGVQLQRYPLLAEFVSGGQIAGILSGAATLEGHVGDLADLRAAGELTLAKVSVTDAKWNGFVIAPLHFDSITAKFSQQGNRLEIQEFEADGKELQISANGQIAVRAPLADSVLNLKLSLAPGPECPDEMKAVLAAIMPPPAKGAKPDAPRMLSGTLAKPRLR